MYDVTLGFFLLGLGIFYMQVHPPTHFVSGSTACPSHPPDCCVKSPFNICDAGRDTRNQTLNLDSHFPPVQFKIHPQHHLTQAGDSTRPVRPSSVWRTEPPPSSKHACLYNTPSISTPPPGLPTTPFQTSETETQNNSKIERGLSTCNSRRQKRTEGALH